MHIGFDAKRVFFNGSGLGNYSRSSVENLCRYFTENRYTLFSPKRGNPQNFDVELCPDIVYPKGIMSVAPSIWRSYAMSGSIKSQGLDIFHGLSNELPSDIQRAGVRSVVTLHDLIFIRYPELYKPLDRALYVKKYGDSCRKADRVIAISNQTKDDLVNLLDINPDKISVVYQGCSPIFYEKSSDIQKTELREKYNLPKEFILSVGTLETRKNLMLTLRAIAEGKLDINLVACGRWTPYVDELMQYALESGIAHKITLLHDVQFLELPTLYQMSRVVVYASIFEGFGIPIIEGLNSGVPVITSEGGVFPETGGDACLYVDLHSVDSMVDALNRAIHDSELRLSLQTLGAQHVLKFREQETAANMMKVYKELM